MALERTVELRLHSFDFRMRGELPLIYARRVDTITTSLDTAAEHFIMNEHLPALKRGGFDRIKLGAASLSFSVAMGSEFGKDHRGPFFYGAAGLICLGVSQINKGAKRLIGRMRLKRDLSIRPAGEILKNLEQYG